MRRAAPIRDPWQEMTVDQPFDDRLRRLVVVSALALGVISLLAIATTDTGSIGLTLLVAGWAMMPMLLIAGLRRPVWRYSLILPATSVSAGLVGVILSLDEPSAARTGWWLITTGVVLGGSLGSWFWYRWLPVPRALEAPFSRGRWALVATHVALIVAGAALVAAGDL